MNFKYRGLTMETRSFSHAILCVASHPNPNTTIVIMSILYFVCIYTFIHIPTCAFMCYMHLSIFMYLYLQLTFNTNKAALLFTSLYSVFLSFERAFVALAGLELTLKTSLPLSSWRSSRFCFQNAGTKITVPPHPACFLLLTLSFADRV